MTPATDLLALGTASMLAGGAVLPSAVYSAAVLAVLAAVGLHRRRICGRVADQAFLILAAAAVASLAVLPWLGQGTALRLALLSAVLVIVGRSALTAALRAAHRHGRLTEPALVVGTGTAGVHVAELLLAHPELGLRPLGFLDRGTPRRDLPLPCLGAPDDIASVVERFRVDRVIVCYSACRDEDFVAVMRAAGSMRSDICVVPRLYELGAAIPRSHQDEIWGIPLVPLRRPASRAAALAAKRTFDVTASIVLLVLALPVLALLAVAVRLESGGAVLFRQTRITGAGRQARILKLRTMRPHGDADTSWTGPEHGSTRIGRWLRGTHLDELPQLVNVLRGEMSLVGPRPERPHFAGQFGEEFQRYGDRTRMPAGITGWAQVHGLHGDTSIAERARFDNLYIEYWSPWLDAVILVRTVGGLLGLTGASR